jgi:hypothetical protein
MSSFEARNLRVQIPCGSVTLINCTLGHTINCFFPTKYCAFPTCHFGTPCHWGTPQTCFWGTPCHWGSPCFFHTCGYHSPIACEVGTMPHLPECPGTEIVQEGPITVLPEHLSVLKEQLQAQLHEIELAEKAVAEAEKEAK